MASITKKVFLFLNSISDDNSLIEFDLLLISECILLATLDIITVILVL